MVHVKEKVLVLDLVNKGSSHSLFNKKIIHFLTSKYDVVFFAYDCTIEHLDLFNFNVRFKSLKKYKSKISRFIYMIFIIYKFSSSKEFKKIYILAMNVREIKTLLFINFIIKNNIDLHIFLHSNLEYILRKKSNLSKFLLKSKIIKIVLGEWILSNIINDHNYSLNIYSLQHPITYKNESIRISNNFNFVFSGICTYDKGFDIYCKICDLFSGIKNVDFNIAGSIPQSYLKKLLLTYKCLSEISIQDTFLTQDMYDEICINSSYILLPHREKYSLISSGAFLDCFNYLKPIITLKNDMSLFYFNKYGNIGYLCDSYEELVFVIDKLINNTDINLYREQVENIKAARLAYSHELNINLNSIL